MIFFEVWNQFLKNTYLVLSSSLRDVCHVNKFIRIQGPFNANTPCDFTVAEGGNIFVFDMELNEF